MVRSAPDEVILDLVRAQLVGGNSGDFSFAASAPALRMGGGVHSDPRALDDAVAEVVLDGEGMSAGDVANAVRVDKARASAALKRLARRGTIQRAGERRFTRYAGDMQTAKSASLRARGRV
ncbi:MAG: hypothetical protein AAGN82_11175 [Myxococcota bacterium]